ncbi:MAG TPA: PKD domain-containing protein [Thermoanaerobaculia bacterium]|nr:PKD domain-containing protein [Thermoanaerobaculia bacterium]
MRRLSPFLTLLLLALVCLPAGAVTITIVNKDAAGKGLNDPTAAAPVGGNPGTTIGEQRMNVFKEAARIWGQILSGAVEIRVDASFSDDPAVMSCSATSATLGGTSPTYVEAQFAGAPEFELWYTVAQANQLAGTDLEPADSDMTAQFNAKLGQPGCLTGRYFYYGFDANTPSGEINFLTVALHEFAHGLGFLSVADESTGAFLGDRGDIFSKHMLDTTSGKTWTEMSSNAERKASAVNTGHLVWDGTGTNAAAAAYLSNKPILDVTSPPAAAGKMAAGTAAFGATLTVAGVPGTLVQALDPSDTAGALTTDACSALTNASSVAGKIALVDRGTCAFAQKASNVQAAGAIGIVVANNTDGVVNMAKDTGGIWQSITIPVVSVSITDGATLKANLPAAGKIGLDGLWRSGSDAAGRTLLYAPNPVETGSSLSHFDTSAIPNLLMEPNINSDLPIGVDITTALLADIGWFGTSPAPLADFTWFAASPKAGDRVQFTDASTGSPTSWLWDFGDGTTSTERNPAHTFGQGTYPVSLTASNSGGSSTKTQSVVVTFSGPVTCSTAGGYTLCLVNGRYRVTSNWQNQYAGGAAARLFAAPLTDATGAFWLTDADVYEYLIRINTATDNGRAWVAIPTFTDVEFWIGVFDTQNGQYKEYHSPAGNRTLLYDPYFFVYP